MTTLAFPDTTGQPIDGSFTYEANGVIYSWTGTYWTANNAQGFDQRYVNADGDQMTGDLTVPSLNGGPLAGFRNLLINGTFNFWQRGTIGLPAPDAVRYYADRWASYKEIGPAINDVQQIVDAPNIPGVSLSTRTNGTDLRQVIEAGGYYLLKAGTTWTLSGWAKGNGSAGTLQPAVYFVAASDPAGASTTIHVGETVDIGADWTYWSTTFTVGSNSPVGQDHVMVSTSTADDLFQTAIQLEAGSVATPFEIRPLGTELALCQRYYQKHDSATDGYSYAFGGYGGAADIEHYCPIQLPVEMRAAPTVTSTAPASAGCNYWAQAGGSSPKGFTYYTKADGAGRWYTYVDYTADAEL